MIEYHAERFKFCGARALGGVCNREAQGAVVQEVPLERPEGLHAGPVSRVHGGYEEQDERPPKKVQHISRAE